MEYFHLQAVSLKRKFELFLKKVQKCTSSHKTYHPPSTLYQMTGDISPLFFLPATNRSIAIIVYKSKSR